jgi:hypothetical protein
LKIITMLARPVNTSEEHEPALTTVPKVDGSTSGSRPVR